MFVMFAIVGVPMGVTGLVDPLAARGVFANNCANQSVDTAAFPCEAQREALNQGINFALSILNVVGLVAGVLIDIHGCVRMSIVGVVLWAVFTALEGFSAPIGSWWLFCFTVSASATCVTALSFFAGLLKPLFATEGGRAMGQAILTGLWDFAATLNFALRFYFLYPGLPLWALYALYAAVGVPTAIMMHRAFQGDFAIPVRPKTMDAVRSTIASSLSILKAPVYWLVLANTTFAVASGYLYVANVGAFFQWRCATEDQAADARKWIPVVIAFVAPFSFIGGYVVQLWGPTVAIQRLLYFQGAATLVFVFLIVGSSSLKVQYVAMMVMGLTRILAFAVSNLVIPVAFAQLGEALGFAFGMNFAVAGAVSLVSGGVGTAAINNQPAMISDGSGAGASPSSSLFLVLVYVFWALPAIGFIVVGLLLSHRSFDPAAAPPSSDSAFMPRVGAVGFCLAAAVLGVLYWLSPKCGA